MTPKLYKLLNFQGTFLLDKLSNGIAVFRHCFVYAVALMEKRRSKMKNYQNNSVRKLASFQDAWLKVELQFDVSYAGSLWSTSHTLSTGYNFSPCQSLHRDRYCNL